MDKLFTDFLPATLTFIVGCLGIISQISINFFSEKKKSNLELTRIKTKNIVEFYTPLVILLREYATYYEALSKDDDFKLTICYQKEPHKTYLAKFLEIHKTLYEFIETPYIPTNAELNKELQKFYQYLINIQCMKSFDYEIDTKHLRGYNVEKLIDCLEKCVEEVYI